MRDLLGNTVLGVAVGLCVGIAVSIFVAGLAVLRGSTAYPELGITTWTAIRWYLIVGVLVGAVLGMLRPLYRSRAGATVGGYVGGVLVYGGIGGVMDGFSRNLIPLALLLGLAGAFLGWKLWPEMRERSRLPNDRRS